MSLKSGTWKANINGLESDLAITEVRGDGQLVGYLTGQSVPGGNLPIKGFWDEVAQSISFMVVMMDISNPGGWVAARCYRGYLFSTREVQPGSDVTWTITGYCEAVPGGIAEPTMEATARRNIFGWFAQLREVV